MRTRPRRLGAAERIVADTTDYTWRTPAGLAKRIGPAATPKGRPQAFTFIALDTQTFHAFTEAQVAPANKERRTRR